MTILACILALTGLPCDRDRGGHATSVRGGHATTITIPLPRVREWTCIHQHEGAWNDPDDPYWGGLQMDRSFMSTYGADMIRKYGGWANTWTPRDQIIVANRAWTTRGYYPWPNTARMCGLI